MKVYVELKFNGYIEVENDSEETLEQWKSYGGGYVFRRMEVISDEVEFTV